MDDMTHNIKNGASMDFGLLKSIDAGDEFQF